MLQPTNPILSVRHTRGSPILIAGATTIFKMMETILISHDNLPVVNLRNQLHKAMTIATNPQVLHYMNRCTLVYVYKSKRNGHLLTVEVKQALFSFIFNVQKDLSEVRFVALQLQPRNHLGYLSQNLATIATVQFFPTRNSWTFPSTSMELQPAIFFTPLCLIINLILATSSHLPALAYMFERRT